MKKVLHKAETRGHASHGWLESYHTFSFAGYYNPSRIQFGALRVLNDDTVAGGEGFGSHPHDNMEIVSIPTEGELEHKDNKGNKGIIKSGDVQIMSAGTGIVHSEYNHNKDKEVKFFQIWVFPEKKNIEPHYGQKHFPQQARLNKIQTVVSPDKNPDSLWINQQAWFSRSFLEAGKSLEYALHGKDKGIYVFVIEGKAQVEDEQLNKRDAAGFWETDRIRISAPESAELLLIEVPMEF
ncbi:MAG: pirin family protein [Candidatus Cyclobacteriaceae bacterium M2_1C_046]